MFFIMKLKSYISKIRLRNKFLLFFFFYLLFISFFFFFFFTWYLYHDMLHKFYRDIKTILHQNILRLTNSFSKTNRFQKKKYSNRNFISPKIINRKLMQSSPPRKFQKWCFQSTWIHSRMNPGRLLRTEEKEKEKEERARARGKAGRERVGFLLPSSNSICASPRFWNLTC